jgi:hypothetical protein
MRWKQAGSALCKGKLPGLDQGDGSLTPGWITGLQKVRDMARLRGVMYREFSFTSLSNAKWLGQMRAVPLLRPFLSMQCRIGERPVPIYHRNAVLL